MDPNTLSIHFSIRDNDEDRIADQGKVIISKTKDWRGLLPAFREHIRVFFHGGKDGKR